MTRPKMAVMAAVMGFLGAVAILAAVVAGGGVAFGQHLGSIYEALTVFNTPNTPSAKLPGGEIFGYLVKDPNLRSMGGATLAAALWVLPWVLLRAKGGLTGRRAQDKESSLKRSKHSVTAFSLVGLTGCLAVAIVFDVAVTWLRVRTDIAAGLASGKAAEWLGLPLDSGTVASVAMALAGLVAIAPVAISIGFAFALELAVGFAGQAWERLGIAREALEEARTRLKDAWLDIGEEVIGATPAGQTVSRRTALLNPGSYLLDDQGRVFDLAFAEALLTASKTDASAQTPAGSKNSAKRWSVHGVLFAVGLGLCAENATAAGLTNGPRVKMFVAVDASKSTAPTAPTSIAGIRGVFQGIMTAGATESRHEPEASYDIALYSVDSFSGEPLWRGTELTAASELTDAWWAAILESRTSYGRCSSFDPLWRRLEAFARDLRPCDRLAIYLLSDLRAEEPLPGRPGACRAQRPGPAAGVPWQVLRRASVVRAYGVPDDVKAAWMPALAKRGLTEKVLMYAGGEPAGPFPVVRPAEVCEPTAEERSAFFGHLVLWGAALAVGVIVLAGLAIA